LSARIGASDSGDVAELYKHAVVIDSLCSPFQHMDASPGPELLTAIRHSGITALNCTVSARTYDGTVENLGWIEALQEQLVVSPVKMPAHKFKRHGSAGR